MTRSPTVLVVEDEALLLMSTVDFIEEAGFTVFAAKNADEAIKILESRDDIGIIFTDIDMPGSMDGVKLAHAVRGRWPPIKIMITSGRPLSKQHVFPDGSHFFAKPYAPEKILKTLHGFTA